MVKFEKCINFNQMHFIKAVFIFILFGSSFKFYSQDLPIVKSQILYSNVFSKETSKEWEETIELYEKLENGDVNFEDLSKRLKDCPKLRVLPQPYDDRSKSCHYCLTILLEEGLISKRPEIMNALTAAGVGCSVYYPQPVPRMSWYQQKYGYEANRYPNAAYISDAGIALPVGPHLSIVETERIAETLIKIMKGY